MAAAKKDLSGDDLIEAFPTAPATVVPAPPDAATATAVPAPPDAAPAGSQDAGEALIGRFPTAPDAPATVPGGIGRNIAAGIAEGTAGVINVLNDPVGNLIGKPLATGLVFAHDALAGPLGYPRFSPETRNMLLGDTVPQPGTRVIDAAGNVLGVKPGDVPANTTTEQLARAGAQGLTMGAAFAPGAALPAVAGAAGGVGSTLAANAAPDWAKPAAALAGGVAGGAVAVPAAAGVNLLSKGVIRLAHPLDPAAVTETTAASPAALPPVAEPSYLSPAFKAAPVASGAVPAVEAARAATPNPLAANPLAAGTPAATAAVPVVERTGNKLSVTYQAVTTPAATGEVPAPASANPYVPQPGEPFPAATDPQATAGGTTGPANENTVAGLRSAGADVTATDLVPPPSADEAQAALYKSVTQSAADRAGPQMHDDTVYVPGVKRTTAAQDFTPANSLDEKTLRATDPAARAELEAQEQRNNETMLDLIQKDAGDPILLKRAYDARDQVSPEALHVFDNEQPTDASGVVQTIDQILRGPEGKRDAVVKALQNVRAKLFDADGNLEESPSLLYGARQNITDLLTKAATGTGTEASNALLAKASLLRVMGELDPVIRDGAPEYQSYLDQWSERSKPIDQMEYLQGKLVGNGKLTDGDGMLRFNRVQALLEDIYKKRGAGDPNPAWSLTPEQIDNVTAIRNELAANRLRDRLAAVRGSDTTQQVSRLAQLRASPLGAAIGPLADLGTHVLIAKATGGLGNPLYAGTKAAIQAKATQRAAAAWQARRAQLLSFGAQPAP